MWVHLTPKSKNRKVGEIPVSTTESSSCPKECSHLQDNTCYAKFGPLGMHWKNVDKRNRGDNWTAFCNRVSRFILNQLWRHDQAGDFPKNKRSKSTYDEMNRSKCLQLAKAAKHTRGWTYTHYDMRSEHNRSAVKEMNEIGGLVVNLSANSLAHADELYQLNIGPVVCGLPADAPHRGNKTPGGLPIVVCPAQTQENMTCEQCKLCQKVERKSIVGFLAHGTAIKRLSTILAEEFHEHNS